MPLPQGIRLVNELGSPQVWIVGPGGRYGKSNPAEMAKLFGKDWAAQIEKVRPGQIDALPQFDSFNEAMRAAPQPGGSNVPQGQVGGQAPGGGVPNPLGSDYGFGQAYQNFLDQEKKSYADVLSGFQTSLAQQRQRNQGISGDYAALQQGVQQQLQGADAAQRRDIAAQYAQQQGQATQNLTSRGLGNTTVADSVGRGLLADKARADTALTGQTSKLLADYQSQLGQAGLGFAADASKMDTSLLGQQLGWMDSFRMPRPDPLGYGQLGQQQRQFQQNNQTQIVPYSYPSPGGGTTTDFRPQRI